MRDGILRMTIEGSLVGIGRQVRGCCRRCELQGNRDTKDTGSSKAPGSCSVAAGMIVPLEAPGLIAGSPGNFKWARKAFENSQGPWN